MINEKYKELEKQAAKIEKTGNTYDAIKIYQEMLTIHETGDVLCLLGACFLDNGFIEDAVITLKRAYSVVPFSLNSVTLYAKALILIKNSHDAIGILTHALELYPKNPDLHYWLGVSHHDAKDFDEALHYLELAFLKLPNCKFVLMEYSICLRAVNDDRSAEQVLAKIAQLAA